MHCSKIGAVGHLWYVGVKTKVYFLKIKELPCCNCTVASSKPFIWIPVVEVLHMHFSISPLNEKEHRQKGEICCWNWQAAVKSCLPYCWGFSAVLLAIVKNGKYHLIVWRTHWLYRMPVNTHGCWHCKLWSVEMCVHTCAKPATTQPHFM